MKAIKWFVFLVAFSLPATLYADFIEEHMFVVNQPSSASAGYDFILEFSAQGTNLSTLISKNLHILGMSDLAFDPVTKHLFYTVSVWDQQLFEIREIDDAGNLLHTYTHADFGGGNIAIAFNRNGDLFIVNDGNVYKKSAASSTISKEFPAPVSVGDLEIDSLGNLYLSDPFVNDVVYKIDPNGTITSFADDTKGIKSPYGMAMDSQDNLYVANSTSAPNLKIIKFDQAGNFEVFNDDTSLLAPGILDMTFNTDNELFVSCRSNNTIIKFDHLGHGTIFADTSDDLDSPKSVAFITYPSACRNDADADGDTDGSDLAYFASDFNSDCLETYASAFGRL